MTIFQDKLNSNDIKKLLLLYVQVKANIILGILVSVRSREKQVIYVLLATRIAVGGANSYC